MQLNIYMLQSFTIKVLQYQQEFPLYKTRSLFFNGKNFGVSDRETCMHLYPNPKQVR